MIASRHSALLKHIRRFKDGGTDEFHQRFRYPLSDMQAAMGMAQLARLDEFVRQRARIAQKYVRALSEIGLNVDPEIERQQVYFRLPIRVPGLTDDHISRLAERGVQARRPVAVMLHQLLGIDRGKFPTAERLYRETISLPLYPSLSDDDFQRTVSAVSDVLADVTCPLEVMR